MFARLEKACIHMSATRKIILSFAVHPVRYSVRVFIVLLYGLFCCLDASSIMFFAVWAGACFLFFCLAGGAGPAQTAKKKHAPAQTAKKNDTPPSLPSVSFFAVWACGRVLFFNVWAVCFCFFFFFSDWAGDVMFFLLFGRGRVFFAVWAGVRVCFCYLDGGRVFFAVWAGDGSSLTYRSAWLVLQATQQQQRPNSKNRKKKKTHTHTLVPSIFDLGGPITQNCLHHFSRSF